MKAKSSLSLPGPRQGSRACEAAAKYRARIAELAVPVLILNGTADVLAPLATARSLRGQALEVAAIDGALHDLVNDRCAAEVARRAVEWLERQLPRA